MECDRYGYPVRWVSSRTECDVPRLTVVSRIETLGVNNTSMSDIPYLTGDIFSPYFLEAVYPFYTPPSSPAPVLSSLTSLNPLHGQVSVVSACFVFDTLDEARQLQLARAIAGLLSPEPGSMIIGAHFVRSDKNSKVMSDGGDAHHSLESWTELWDGGLFQKGTVEVKVVLIEPEAGRWVMDWMVTRL